MPGADASKPLGAPQWTKLVKAVFKAHAGVPLAPKELRSSFITFLRSGHNSDAALKYPNFCTLGSRPKSWVPQLLRARSAPTKIFRDNLSSTWRLAKVLESFSEQMDHGSRDFAFFRHGKS